MKKTVAIIGGGIAGLTAGIHLQKAGYATVIYEKNPVAGGQCMGWKREGYTIDNCIHWMTEARPGSDLNNVWVEIGALGPDVKLNEKEIFYNVEANGQRVTFWRDKERTRRELIELSPEDKDEINKLIDMTTLAESMTVPCQKPFDALGIIDFIKMGKSMAGMGKVMKEYGKEDVGDLANRFKHPLIRRAFGSYMPSKYQAYAFVSSYGTVTSGNGDIPEGMSLGMVGRIVDRYNSLGGTIRTSSPVEKVLIEGKKAKGIKLENGEEIFADFVICANDVDFTFRKLLPEKYMPKEIRKQFDERRNYPVTSSFQIAYAVEGNFEHIPGTTVFECEKMHVGLGSVDSMSIQTYEMEPDFAPEGHMIVQSSFFQYEGDFEYWSELYNTDKVAYKEKKQEIATEAMKRVIAHFPELEGRIRVLDVWTPMTYVRYCNSYKGSYMSFIVTKGAKRIMGTNRIKGLDNVFIGTQWQMGPGGLPCAVACGKSAAWRIIHGE